MLKKIGTKNVREKMGEILDCVNLRGDEFVIERKNKPLAVLIPFNKFQNMENISRQFLLEFLERQSSDLSEEEADALANEAKHNVRKKKSPKRKKKS